MRVETTGDTTILEGETSNYTFSLSVNWKEVRWYLRILVLAGSYWAWGAILGSSWKADQISGETLRLQRLNHSLTRVIERQNEAVTKAREEVNKIRTWVYTNHDPEREQ